MRSVDENPYIALRRSAPLLISRGFVMAVFQFGLKRIIFAQKNESLLADYAEITGIEGFIFIFLFSGVHIISSKASHLHADETNPLFDPKKVGELYQQGILLGLSLLLPVGLLCVLAPTLFRLVGQPEKFVKESGVYFQYAFIAYFLDILYRTQARIAIGLSHSEFALAADSVESVLDTFFTYLLVNGKLGFREMGVESGALAYAISAGITAAGHALYVHSRADFRAYHLFHNQFRNAAASPEFKNIVMGGFYLSFSGSVIYFTQMMTTFLCGLSSQAALIGLQAASVYDYLITLMINGFSEAGNVVIGKLFKSRSPYFREIGNFLFLSCLIFSLICCLFLYFFVRPIASLFMNPDRNTQQDFEIVKSFLYIQAVMEVIMSISHVGSDVLSACLETRFPFLLNMGFIFLLNASLSASVYVLSDQNISAMYAVQLVGLFFNSAGILFSWSKQPVDPEKPEDKAPCVSRLFTFFRKFVPVSFTQQQNLPVPV